MCHYKTILIEKQNHHLLSASQPLQAHSWSLTIANQNEPPSVKSFLPLQFAFFSVKAFWFLFYGNCRTTKHWLADSNSEWHRDEVGLYS